MVIVTKASRVASRERGKEELETLGLLTKDSSHRNPLMGNLLCETLQQSTIASSFAPVHVELHALLNHTINIAFLLLSLAESTEGVRVSKGHMLVS